ncbi:recombinase family protein [Enterobacter mori]|uniref:recombinase family protein n=1 Tax=Enterobacter mori TaxID=539813 RepID=UPI003B84494D
MRIYAYLRASTREQDATRATAALEQFATEKGLTIAARFTENESGSSLKHPDLFRLLDVAQAGDVLLVEQVDRLSRLNTEDWQSLRGLITGKGVRVVALDLPTSHTLLQTGDEFTSRMMDAINGMMLDMLAAIARKDYTDRRRRQAEGIEKARAGGLYKGKQINQELHGRVSALLGLHSQRDIARIVGCSLGTVKNVVKAQKEMQE